MSLYAIGDLHLHFQTDLKAKAQLKDRAWKNHAQKVQKYCAEMIRPDDTLVDSIPGEKNGIRYSLVSGDYLKWKPMKVL